MGNNKNGNLFRRIRTEFRLAFFTVSNNGYCYLFADYSQPFAAVPAPFKEYFSGRRTDGGESEGIDSEEVKRPFSMARLLVYCGIKAPEQKLVDRTISRVCCPGKTFKTQRRLRGF